MGKKLRLKKPKLSLLNLLARNDEPEKLKKEKNPRKLRVRRSRRRAKPENLERHQRNPEKERNLDELENQRKEDPKSPKISKRKEISTIFGPTCYVCSPCFERQSHLCCYPQVFELPRC